MKYSGFIPGILFVLLLFTVTACGGGGTSGGTTSTSTTSGTFTSIRMEAINTSTTATVDPSNIFVNENIQFRLTGLDSTLNRVVIPTSGYGLVGSPAGSLNASGLFSANSTPSPNFGTVRVVFDGNQFSSTVRVVQPDAILLGLGRTTDGFPSAGIQIKALNAAGATVATGLVASDGTIRMSLPTTSVRFTTNFALVDPGPQFYYARQFAYNSKDYSTIILTCTAPLPALTSGVASNLASALVFYRNSSGSPPPPPDGCQ
jgi:hypothetical protein